MKFHKLYPRTAGLLASCLAWVAVAQADEPALKDIAAKIDVTTGKASDTASEFTVEGIVAARSTLPDGSVLAILQEDESALPVLLAKDTKVKPRDAVTFTGKLADHALGLAALHATKESVSGSDKPLKPTPHSLAECNDAAAFAGDYVVLTNVMFDVSEPKFATGKSAVLKDAAGNEVKMLVGTSLNGREKPNGPVNLFGAMVKTADGWSVLPARFVPADSSQVRRLAMKHTCMSCHQPDKKLIGPAYVDVAAKYRDDPGALDKVVAQIENGGSGKWGAVPMVGFKGRVPPDEIQTLAHWIMEMRWDAVLAD